MASYIDHTFLILGSALSLTPYTQCIGTPIGSILLKIRPAFSNGLQSPMRHSGYVPDLTSHQSPLAYSDPAGSEAFHLLFSLPENSSPRWLHG